MNITPFDVYLVMQLDSINCVVSVLCAALVLLAVILIHRGADNMDSGMRWGKEHIAFQQGKKLHNLGIGSATSAVLLLLCLAFIPSTKTAASMFLLPAIANNKEVQQLPEDLLKMVRGLVKEWTPKEDVKKEGK